MTLPHPFPLSLQRRGAKDKMLKIKIVVIVGPTASGKSDVAVALAKKLSTRGGPALGWNGAEVISADSRQVYKGLDIGTGKITKKEMRGVRHHLLDVVSPRLRQGSAGQAKKQFTVADYKTLTNLAIAQIVKVGKVPIICGGTGFYISAFLGEINVPEVKPNETLRKQLAKKSAEELFKILQKLDSVRSRTIDKNNPRRLIRAIEIAKALGRVPKIELRSMNYEVCKIGIKIPNEELRKRIKRRIDGWIKKGLIKEVQNLRKKGLSWKRMAEIGLEYKIIANFLRGDLRKVSRTHLDISALKQKMVEKTWQYAKRQMTWFKRDKKIVWLPPKIKIIQKEVREFLE